MPALRGLGIRPSAKKQAVLWLFWLEPTALPNIPTDVAHLRLLPRRGGARPARHGGHAGAVYGGRRGGLRLGCSHLLRLCQGSRRQASSAPSGSVRAGAYARAGDCRGGGGRLSFRGGGPAPGEETVRPLHGAWSAAVRPYAVRRRTPASTSERGAGRRATHCSVSCRAVSRGRDSKKLA